MHGGFGEEIRLSCPASSHRIRHQATRCLVFELRSQGEKADETFSNFSLMLIPDLSGVTTIPR